MANRYKQLFISSSWLLLSLIAAVFLPFIYYLNIPLWLDFYNETVNAPKYYALILFCAAAFAVLKPSSVKDFLKTNYAKWCIAILVMYALNFARVYLLEFPDDEVTFEYNKFQLFLMAPAFAFIIFSVDSSFFRQLLVLLAIVAPCLLIFDFLNPGILQPFDPDQLGKDDEARVAGTWLNSNLGAEAVLLSLVLIRNHVTRLPMAIIFTLATFAIVATGSRAGMGGIVLVGLFFLIRRKLPIYYLIVPILVVFSYPTIIDMVEDTAKNSGRGSGVSDLRNRLEFFTGESEQDESTAHRTGLIGLTFTAALSKPLIGHGTEYIDLVWNVGPHNMPLALFYTYGIGGLLAWLALAIVLFKHSSKDRWFQPVFFLYVWFSFFTHNMYSGHFWYIFLAFSMYQSSNVRPMKMTSIFSSSKKRKPRSHRSQTEKEVDRLVKRLKRKK